jgi:hypothetical protein
MIELKSRFVIRYLRKRQWQQDTIRQKLLQIYEAKFSREDLGEKPKQKQLIQDDTEAIILQYWKWKPFFLIAVSGRGCQNTSRHGSSSFDTISWNKGTQPHRSGANVIGYFHV